jgi:hypothetical protein
MDKITVNRSGGGSSRNSSEQGYAYFTPRFKLQARNKDIPAGSIAVVEYFSKGLAQNPRRKERVEHIVLPEIGKGKQVLIDGEGVILYRYIYTYGTYRQERGFDFLGLTVSIFSTSGERLLQMTTHQNLSEESAGKELPPPASQEPGFGYL